MAFHGGEIGLKQRGFLIHWSHLSVITLPCLAMEAHAQTAIVDNGLELPVVHVQAASNRPVLAGTIPDTPETAYEVSNKAINILSPGGSANAFRAVSILPSVYAPAIDPYGLANIPGSNKGIRIRGEASSHGNSISTVEGIPLGGVNPGPGFQWLFPTENVDSMQVYQGPIAPDKGSFFTTAGAINTQLRWGEDKPGAEITQGFGSFNFFRTFARVDSGALFNGTTHAFASGSWTDAENWRGPGKAANGNTTASFGLSTKITDQFDARLYFSYANMQQNTYRPLNYMQTQNLGLYRFYDYSANPNAGIAYFNNNRQSFEDWVILSELTYHFNENTQLTVKPYYFSEKGAYYDGMANGMVRNWLLDHDSYGLTSEISTRLLETDMKLGYWWTTMQLPGPPNAWKMYMPNAYGGLNFNMWSILAQATTRNEFQSAYAMMDKKIGPLHLQAGARYMWENIPGINAFNTMGVSDTSYNAAIGMAPGINGMRSVSSHVFGAFLPYMAASYDLTPNLQANMSVGANYGAPSFDIFPAYQQNAATFQAKGISADQLWSTLKAETSTNIDVGLRWTYESPDIGTALLEPRFYYAKYANKGVSFDPGIGVAYSQNVADTHAIGGQLMAHWLPRPELDLFASVGYTRNVFDANLPTLPGASAATIMAAAVKGTQFPDVPNWTMAAGLNWSTRDPWLGDGQLTISPIINYISDRWGDTTRTQHLSGYATVDLNIGYDYQTPIGLFNASLTVTNLFDTSYIGYLNTSYYQQAMGTNAYYYPGAPRAFLGRLALKI
ncbi:TonB-dependent receptor [Beijerinckia indica subsp. indica ATCC 9039]|uniref:TonB-dependent receptor n=1 Tax=Beijerinckia indica subsp. indica (strain ATCC 9039 / DSM 1715 / NCIMB 8712) TaxID=395963 RepID=B2IDC1_BEII9|nr:TonB-dependent receptor [Beijerinckia indica subsp. indica ATCC 9039]